MLKILHLSDFHYRENHHADFLDVGEKIADTIKNQEIDLVVFSGDLVFCGDNLKVFNDATTSLITPIKRVTGLDNSRFLIAPGNHDLHKGMEMKVIEKALASEQTSVKEIDDFCQDKRQLNESLKNFSNFNSFINDFYEDSMTVTPLYSYCDIEIKGTKIGLIAFNSAWRCDDSQKDRGKLIYPVYMVREAFEKVKDCDLVICAQHHNLSDYADFIAQEIEDIINEKCHILFTGHYHKNSIETTFNTEIGLLHLSAPAIYNRYDNTSYYGFSIIEFDGQTYEGMLKKYVKNEDKFIKVENKPIAIPMSQEKHNQNEFRKLLRKRYQETLEKADALFVSDVDNAFKLLFRDPIIKNKSEQEEIVAIGKVGERYSLSDILENDNSTIIFGQNKRGKTCLLRWLQLEGLKVCLNKKVIPYFLDAKRYRNNRFNLMDLLRGYLELNANSVKNKFNEYCLLLLIDDLSPNEEGFLNKLKIEMENFPHVRFIATVAESMSDRCALINFVSTDVDKYYIHNITKKEIHQLTKSWPNISKERKKVAEEKIIQIFSQMHISFNYWTTSLFLWIFEKTDPNNIHNNFELVKLYVDELLGKTEFINNKSFTTEYEDLKSYLGYIAERILNTKDYGLDENELYNATDEYKRSHKKFTDDSFEIIDYLKDKGIIYKLQDKYTIRLKGIFEFFIAYRMTDKPELLNAIIDSSEYPYAFLSFGNELEYYAGFRKNDFDTFEKIFQRSKTILEPLTSRQEYEIIDDRLGRKLEIKSKDVQITGNLMDRLNEMSDEERDELSLENTKPVDDSKLTPKKIINDIPLNSSIMERILFILSRMYRNSNICDKEVLSKEMLNYILTGTCNLGFMFIDEARSFNRQDNLNKVEALIQLISNFIPIIIEGFLYDAICQKNLVRVFKTMLDELIKSPQNNQLRIFLITYILVDIDIKEFSGYMKKALDIIDNKILRYAILNKNVLLTIRYSDDDSIKKMLSEQRKGLIKEFKGLDNFNDNVNKFLVQKKNREDNEGQQAK